MPSDPDARLFYRAADRRLTEAEVLRKAAQTTGAVYLAGYGVECKLKAVILGSLATEARTAMLTLLSEAREGTILGGCGIRISTVEVHLSPRTSRRLSCWFRTGLQS